MKKILLFAFVVFCCAMIAVPAFAEETMQETWTNALKWIVEPMDEGLPQACWFCPIYREMFILLNNMGMAAADTLQDFFLKLLQLGSAFFIVLYVGKHIVSMKEIEMGDFLRGLLVPMGKVILAALLLVNVHALYYWLINPALQTSIDFGSILLDTAGTSAQLSQSISVIRSVDGGVSLTADCNVNELADLDTSQLISSSLLYENETYKKVLCYMSTAGRSLSVGMALGVALTDYAFSKSWYRNFREMWIGLLITVSYLSLLIMFGIKLIDPLIRLTIVSALLPLWIIFAVFPATAGYTKEAIKTIIGVMGTFIMLSIVLSVVVAVMGRALGSDEQVSRIFSEMALGLANGATFRYVNWKVSLWCLGYAMICWKLLGSVEGLVKTFAGAEAGGSDAAKTLEALGMKIAMLGGMLARSSKNLAVTGVVAGGKGAAAGTRWGIGKWKERHGGDKDGKTPASRRDYEGEEKERSGERKTGDERRSEEGGTREDSKPEGRGDSRRAAEKSAPASDTTPKPEPGI